jgi:hypothetical protein
MRTLPAPETKASRSSRSDEGLSSRIDEGLSSRTDEGPSSRFDEGLSSRTDEGPDGPPVLVCRTRARAGSR